MNVLASVHPQYCELIASGKKTVEVRKTKPKIDTPFKCYIYCTKSRKPYESFAVSCKPYECGGKVIGEFVCNEFTYIEAGYDTNGNRHLYNTAFIEHRMCIPDNELFDYLYKSRENSGGWGWHISNLVIYDKPKELSEFRYYSPTVILENGYPVPTHEIKRPPQSWCYVEGKEDEGK